MSFHLHLTEKAAANTNYREVLFTGEKSQLVVMSINPGDDIGEEVHEGTEQTLYIHSGSGKAILDDKEFPLTTGDVLIVTPGTKHNVKNTGDIPMKITTVYAPAHHIDGRVHATKEDAENDTADEEFGGDES